ncbi:hypothetical protein H6F67_01105 [Microcoleus sp. FACHB-1515]|uniref:hypothetical protein n=2 Tax=Cyanophyceae TaxID=3028117 RepID=UPI0019C6810E|nr:hypothetical protein [Microcoleus sp. FACHB-1515]MBD2088466.1 hypothetical protein [Microcoleus sp. FACHB-1515]
MSVLRKVGKVLTIVVAAIAFFSSSATALSIHPVLGEIRSDVDVIQYPAPNASNTGDLGPIDQQVFERDATQIPAQRQPITDPSDPDARLLEKVGEEFKESTGFLKGLQQKAGEEATEGEKARRR